MTVSERSGTTRFDRVAAELTWWLGLVFVFLLVPGLVYAAYEGIWGAALVYALMLAVVILAMRAAKRHFPRAPRS